MLQIQNCYIFQNKCKKGLRAENIALTDLLKYTLEVLNLFAYNTSLLAIYKGTIKNCGNYVQVKVKISEFSPLLLLLVKNIPMRIHKWFEPIVWPAHTDTALSLLANRSLQGGWSICLNLCVAKHTQENANFLRSYFWLALLVLIFEAVWFLGILLVSPQKIFKLP